MARILGIPNLGSAEEEIIFVGWEVDPGDEVKRGHVLAAVETKKAAFELEADADLILVACLAEEGQSLGQGAAYAIVAAPGEQPDEAELELLRNEAEEVSCSNSAMVGAAPAEFPQELPDVSPETDGGVIPRARMLAGQWGIDLGSLQGTGPGGVITVADVEEARVRIPGHQAAPDGTMDPAFLDLIRGDRAAFAALSSAFKVALYRRHGALIGEGVHLQDGSVLLAQRIVIEEGVFVGAHVLVECARLFLGRNTFLGPRSSFIAEDIHIGRNAYFVRDVECGGGGARDPMAFLRVGDDGFIGEGVHLNTCRGVTIGDEVTVSRNVVVMTHSFAQSELEGYPTAFEPVVVENNSQIGIGCTLFPGSRVGKGAIVLSNSSVVGQVTEGRLFGGVPARDLKAACRPLDESARRRIATDMLESFVSLLQARGHGVEAWNQEEQKGWVVEAEGRSAVLLYRADAGEWMLPRHDGLNECELVLVQLQGMPWMPEERPAGVVAIDLDAREIRGTPGPLSDSLREHLRKRGLRLRPGGWTYRGGWI